MTIGFLHKFQAPGSAGGATTQLMYSGARLQKDVFISLKLADHIVREAEAAARHVRERGDAALEARKREAHTQGYSQGRAQALAGVLGTLEVERRLREILSHRLAEIVEHCLQSLLGEIGDARALRLRILNLLRTGGVTSVAAPSSGMVEPIEAGVNVGSATLHVNPAQFAEVRALVLESGKGEDQTHNIAGLVVVSDARRRPDALLLETRLQFLESNLELTLQQTRDLVRDAVDHACKVTEGQG